MSQLRHDPIQRRWVIIAEERSGRPHGSTMHADFSAAVDPCPFCAGNEHLTPNEIAADRPNGSPNGPDWYVRVVPNKFPALQIEGELDRTAEGHYDRLHGIGAHEVIIETPYHNVGLAAQPIDQFVRILRVYRDRLRDLQNDPRFRYILLFKNDGQDAGASLAHPHSQIIATPVTPRTVADELDAARAHFQVKERCLFCDLMRQELSQGDRLVLADDHFVTYCPFASRFPYEMTLMPRRHAHDFSLLDEAGLFHLATHFKEVLCRMAQALNAPPYNFLLHTAPNTRSKSVRQGYWETLADDWHWHFEILPRLSRVAGFEWGTGFYINSVPPEVAAADLREAQTPNS